MTKIPVDRSRSKAPCRTGEKFTQAVREAGVSGHNAVVPLKPLNAILLYCSRGLRGALNWAPMMPRGASLLEKLQSDRCSFSSLGDRNIHAYLIPFQSN